MEEVFPFSIGRRPFRIDDKNETMPNYDGILWKDTTVRLSLSIYLSLSSFLFYVHVPRKRRKFYSYREINLEIFTGCEEGSFRFQECPRGYVDGV